MQENFRQFLGRLRDAQPGEEPELDDAALLDVERRQRIEGLVEREHVHAGRRSWTGRSGCFAQADNRGTAAALAGPLPAGVVHEDLSHQPGRQRKEVRA